MSIYTIVIDYNTNSIFIRNNSSNLYTLASNTQLSIVAKYNFDRAYYILEDNYYLVVEPNN